jgi:hypothetical protein
MYTNTFYQVKKISEKTAPLFRLFTDFGSDKNFHCIVSTTPGLAGATVSTFCVLNKATVVKCKMIFHQNVANKITLTP